MQELVGKIIDGRFRVDSFLAAGGMGAVFRGTQLSVERDVAIKVILDQKAAPEQIAIERFFREAQSISQLSHPNIVNLVDFGRDEELTYLVMEFVEGVPLSSLIERDVSNPAFVIETLKQVTEALTEAHAKGLVHRDLKPDNILVGTKASGALQIKVVDFGIARLQEYETISDSGAVVGTPNYMSPEQAQDLPIDGRSDLFALGVIAYEMITGTLPFAATEPLQTMMKICNEPLPPVAERVADANAWPVELLNLTERLMEKAPEARIESANLVLTRLDEIVTQHELKTPRIDGPQALAEIASSPSEVAFVRTVTTETKTRSSHLPALFAALLLVGGIVAVATVISSERGSELSAPETETAIHIDPSTVESTKPEIVQPVELAENPEREPQIEEKPEVVEEKTPINEKSVKRKKPIEVKEKSTGEPPPAKNAETKEDSLEKKMKWLKSRNRD